MKRKDAVAPIFAPPARQGTIQIPQPEPRERRPVITHASNQSVPFPIGCLLLVVYLALAFLIAYFGGEWAGAPVPIRMVFGGVLATVMAFATMAFITGDAMGMWESAHVERTERKWAGVEAVRIEAVRDVALAESDIRLEQIRTEQMKIEADQTAQHLHRRMAQIESAIDAAKEVDAGPDRTDNYVDNQPQPARVAVRDFVASCYGVDGFDPDFAYDNGGLVRAPWNNLWRAEPWRTEAKKIMWDSVLEGQPNQPRLKYDNNNDAQRAIGRS